MQNFIKSIFVIKEDGTVCPLVIREDQVQDNLYLCNYRIGENVWTERYEGISDVNCRSLKENDMFFPEFDILSLYLNGETSDILNSLFMENKIVYPILGFFCLEYFTLSFNPKRHLELDEIYILNGKLPEGSFPNLQAYEYFPLIKERFPLEEDFDAKTSEFMYRLHSHSREWNEDMWYSCGFNERVYGSKDGVMYRKDKYNHTLDDDKDCDEEWLDAFRHLYTFQRNITNVRCLDAEETTAMINSYQCLIDEGKEKIAFLKKHCSNNETAANDLKGRGPILEKKYAGTQC